jgi:hypothetical protein
MSRPEPDSPQVSSGLTALPPTTPAPAPTGTAALPAAPQTSSADAADAEPGGRRWLVIAPPTSKTCWCRPTRAWPATPT